MATSRIRIVIADRQPVFLCGLRALLIAQHDLHVVASCHDGATCTDAIREHSPDLALLDMTLWGGDDVQLPAVIRAENLVTRIVLLSASVASCEAAKAIAAGAYGVISREIAPDVLLCYLRYVAVGPRSLSLPELQNGLDGDLEAGPTTLAAMLTEREREITNLVCSGLSNKEIGRLLGISEGTIKVHLHHVFEKLAINNRTALAALHTSDMER